MLSWIATCMQNERKTRTFRRNDITATGPSLLTGNYREKSELIINRNLGMRFCKELASVFANYFFIWFKSNLWTESAQSNTGCGEELLTTVWYVRWDLISIEEYNVLIERKVKQFLPETSKIYFMLFMFYWPFPQTQQHALEHNWFPKQSVVENRDKCNQDRFVARIGCG